MCAGAREVQIRFMILKKIFYHYRIGGIVSFSLTTREDVDDFLKMKIEEWHISQVKIEVIRFW